MITGKIDKVKLSKLLRAGKTGREIAQYFGVTDGAISKAKKELNINVVRSVGLENAHEVVHRNLDAVSQLQSINEKANKMLDELTGEDKLIDRMVKAVEGALSFEGEPDKQARYIRRVVKQVATDRFLALKAMQEIRGQLGLQLDIFRTLYDMEAIAEFQREVLSAIGEVSKDVRERIVHKLKEARTLRGSISVN